MQNKKGLSAIVITLILIAVSLAVVGIVWYVINNVLSDTSNQIQQDSQQLFQTCVEASLTKMNTTSTCGGTPGDISYIGGEKCCDGTCIGCP